MSTLIRDKQLISNDAWQALSDEEQAPRSGSVVVSLARWLKEAEGLAHLNVGVRIPNTTDVAQVWSQLSARPLIVLEFPGFADGRAYSQAYVLRNTYAYKGEIRASGSAVVRDHLYSMARCGINSFELRADQNAQTCLQAFDDFSLSYQPATDGQPLIFRRRA